MERINNYETMVEAIQDLQSRGYTQNFSINENGFLIEANGNGAYLPSKIELHEIHRFEGNTNPSDTSILYAVKIKLGEKGIVVDAYGADGSEVVAKFMNSIAKTQNNSQLSGH